ncbi:MAG: hypothetical protein GY785_11425 [Gammaproteobacteria bacterium]|nr:hypothetical protein [Gammaproteobacteria bacterium]
MNSPFFLTRQTANLMEDFVRELKADASLFLLYGESGVGKTRLLKELKRTRLTDSKIHWIDLKTGGSGDGSLVDSSSMVEDTFARAQPGDIIIADHFEMALQKTRHQLFLSWSADGPDKQVNLIVSSNDQLFEEIQELAKQYQIRAQSFQLMALKPEEAAAFLGFYLFPDRPIGKLSIPAILQEQLTAAQGAIGKIVEIVERTGDQITIAPLDDVETLRKDSKNMVGILIGVAFVIGMGWYFLSSQSRNDDMPVTASDVAAPQETTAMLERIVRDESTIVPATSQPVVDGAEPGDTVVSDIVDEADASPEEASVEPAAVEAPVNDEAPVVIEEPSEDSVELMSEAGTASGEDAVLVDESSLHLTEEPTAVEADEVLMETNTGETEATAPEVAPLPPTGTSRFADELQASLDWINRSDKKVGTIQIMMLSYDKFDDQAYYDYVDYLATRRVDTSALKTFMTYTGGRKVYSVVYGEYESWRAARDAIAGLPTVLRDTSPIPRSAGGLLKEIRRLEAEN